MSHHEREALLSVLGEKGQGGRRQRLEGKRKGTTPRRRVETQDDGGGVSPRGHGVMAPLLQSQRKPGSGGGGGQGRTALIKVLLLAATVLGGIMMMHSLASKLGTPPHAPFHAHS